MSTPVQAYITCCNGVVRLINAEASNAVPASLDLIDEMTTAMPSGMALTGFLHMLQRRVRAAPSWTPYRIACKRRVDEFIELRFSQLRAAR